MPYTLISLKTSLMQYDFYKQVLSSSEAQVAIMQRLQTFLDLLCDLKKSGVHEVVNLLEESDLTEQVLEHMFPEASLSFQDRMLKFMEDYGRSIQMAHSSAGWLALGALHDEVSWCLEVVHREDQAALGAVKNKRILSGNFANTVWCCGVKGGSLKEDDCLVVGSAEAESGKLTLL